MESSQKKKSSIERKNYLMGKRPFCYWCKTKLDKNTSWLGYYYSESDVKKHNPDAKNKLRTVLYCQGCKEKKGGASPERFRQELESVSKDAA